MAHGQGGAEIGFDRGPTLTCNHEAPIAALPVAPPITFGAQMSVPQTDVDMVQTLQAKNPMAVAQPVAFVDVGATLKGGSGARGYPDPSDGNGHNIVAQAAMQVRRLTPVECERLQGFPDGYTAIPWRGKSAGQCPDGPRYKALGNSMAVPVMRWIGERIQAVENIP